MEASVAAAIDTLGELVIRKGHGKMAMLLSYLWLGATTMVAFFVRLLAAQLFRRKEEDGEHDSSISASAELLSKVGKPEELEVGGGGGQEPTHVFQFKFGFQIPEQSNSSRGVPTGEDGGSSSTTVTSISNYRFVSDGGRRGFVEAPQAMTLRIQESYIDSDGIVRSTPAKLDRFGLLLTAVGSLDISDDEVKSRVPLAKHSPPRAESDGGVSKELDGELKSMMRLSLMSPESRSEYDSEEVGAAACETLGAELPDEAAGVPAGDHYRGGFSSDSESESGSDGYSVKDLTLDFDSDGLFPEKDVEADAADEASSSGSDVEEDDPVEFEQKSEATQLSNSPDEVSPITSHVGFDTEHGRVLDQLAVEDESESLESREITEGTELSDSCGSDKESAEGGSDELGQQGWEDHELQGGSEETQLIMENSDELSTEEMEETESPWEHDDLLDRLRLDLKKAMAATGLPTILEESESPKPAEEGLEPWKPDAPRFLREDPMEGLRKFYRSYRERMRKLDVLNRQQMYAIGFLQLKKDPLKPGATQKKPIIPAIASALSHNLRRRRSSDDPSEKLVRELRSGVELVYVGQTCLSWEFLRHQYETTRQLLLGSGGGRRPYNQSVGEEFQQFQVLLERFLENEPFQGPRVPNYAKNRCVLRRLLQVPVVREDCVKDKAEAIRRRTKDAMTGEELEYVMEDSIRVFWDFVRSEKEETPSIVRGLFGAHGQVELQDPVDSNFMADVQTHLRQKQKRLKDVLRSGNCIVKKFKNKQQQGGPSQDDLFFSQVDLKLVSRVLRMTRITTDQLVWCHKKLSRISFADRKLTREPSFLLFPC